MAGNPVEAKLIDFFSKDAACLFAGAGVGVKAGMPTWYGFINMLIDQARKYEPETASLMTKRLESNLLLEAVTLFTGCPVIPKGEIYRALSEPFLNYDEKQLLTLMSLPFSSVVTTNYDRSLYDSYYCLYEKQKESGLKLKSPLSVELGDPSLKQAIYWSDFYIARIHGRAEIPETIIIDNEGYNKLNSNAEYQDFVLHILKNYRCLFIGFSFLDPAINKILSIMKDCLPQPYPKLHLAILPDDANTELKVELAKYNIETFYYSPLDGHAQLWDGIKVVQKTLRTKPREKVAKILSVKGIERFLATCYSRLKLGERAEPLFEVVAEGIIAQAIADAGDSGITKSSLINVVKKYFNLPDDNIENIISRAYDGLSDKGICSKTVDTYVCNINDSDKYHDSMTLVVGGVVNRLIVREGLSADDKIKTKIEQLIQKILITRGWDLGALFAGRHNGDSYDSWDHILELIKHDCKDLTEKQSLSIANSIYDTLRHPNDDESEVLCDLGRVAFAMELVMNQSATVVKTTLVPETIYLDSNVLLPVIVEGHPYSPIYADVIERVRTAVMEGGKTLRVYVGRGFLNEVVSHRALAVEEIKVHSLDKLENLRRLLTCRGAENVNVFIGAYSSYVARIGDPLTFSEFIDKVAPYTTEDELSAYLKKHGITPINFNFVNNDEVTLYKNVKGALTDAYHDLKLPKPKVKILIEHEAAQLATLIIDSKHGRKPIFVSADKKLMSLCNGPVLNSCSSSIVTHLGLIQLVDLILGVTTDKRSLARMMWNIGINDKKAYVREYLISQALRHYDDAMAMAMWEVVDNISELAADAAIREKINFYNKSDLSINTAFLDRFENDFFGSMAIIIEKRKNQ